jgi:hypothetical protein
MKIDIELRKINLDLGEDHERLEAEIYLNNRKIGEVVNDGWSDELYIEFKNEQIKNRFYGILSSNKICMDKLINDQLFAHGFYRYVKDPTLRNCFQVKIII